MSILREHHSSFYKNVIFLLICHDKEIIWSEKQKSWKANTEEGRDWVLHGVKQQGKKSFRRHRRALRPEQSMRFAFKVWCTVVFLYCGNWHYDIFAQQIININVYPINLLHWHLSFPSAWTHHYSLWDYGHGRRSMTIKGAQNWKWTLPRNNLTFSSKENCETAKAFLRLVELRLSQPA